MEGRQSLNFLQGREMLTRVEAEANAQREQRLAAAEAEAARAGSTEAAPPERRPSAAAAVQRVETVHHRLDTPEADPIEQWGTENDEDMESDESFDASLAEAVWNDFPPEADRLGVGNETFARISDMHRERYVEQRKTKRRAKSLVRRSAKARA